MNVIPGLSSQMLLGFVVAAPLVAFLVLSGTWLMGRQVSERAASRLTAITFLASTLATVTLALNIQRAGWIPVTVDLGNWFAAADYKFPLLLLADSLSLPLLALTVILSGVIGSFSSRYLHRDRGYFRFFLLLHLFSFGAELAFTAGTLDFLIFGWELVGLTSVLLIAFFNERIEPVRNALRTFAIYRITDVGLLVGVFVLHHVVGSASSRVLFRGSWPEQGTILGPGAATIVGLLFLFAALGKSAQVPFSGWLPRAMEGPTPSSAIFYGGISVHLGVYLLLRAQPILHASPIAPTAVVVIGLITAIHATLTGRAATDAKTSLAYATLAQLGVIFVEIGLGFGQFALYHLIGHAAIRTLQFLRAPSMLHDYHRVHAAAGGHLSKTGSHYETLLPAGARRWLYRLALDRCHLDALIELFVAGPVVRCAQKIAALDRGNRSGVAASKKHVPLDYVAREGVGGIDV